MSRSTSLFLAAAVLSIAAPLIGQGAFNMKSMTQTLNTATGNGKARRARQAGIFFAAFGSLARSRAPTHARYDATPVQFRAVARQVAVAAADAELARPSDATKQELPKSRSTKRPGLDRR